jgi:hypothetical protein
MSATLTFTRAKTSSIKSVMVGPACSRRTAASAGETAPAMRVGFPARGDASATLPQWGLAPGLKAQTDLDPAEMTVRLAHERDYPVFHEAEIGSEK